MRLYDTGDGVIKADSRDIKAYDTRKYRDTIGTVFQDFQIFAGTVRENVVLDVADGIDDGGIRKALSESGLMERVDRFEKGMDTELTTEFSEEPSWLWAMNPTAKIRNVSAVSSLERRYTV